MTTGTPGVQVYFVGVGGSGRSPPTPNGVRRGGQRADPVNENLVYEKFSKRGRETVIARGAEVTKGYKVARRAVLWGAWRRWGAESGKVSFSLMKT